jgi:hypothetical protein
MIWRVNDQVCLRYRSKKRSYLKNTNGKKKLLALIYKWFRFELLIFLVSSTPGILELNLKPLFFSRVFLLFLFDFAKLLKIIRFQFFFKGHQADAQIDFRCWLWKKYSLKIYSRGIPMRWSKNNSISYQEK